MNAKTRDTSVHSAVCRVAQEAIPMPEVDYCACMPISHLCTLPPKERALLLGGENVVSRSPIYDIKRDEGDNGVVPVTDNLNSALRSVLHDLFPRSTAISVLLLHVSQLEHMHIPPHATVFYKRHRYHASDTLLEQILVNVYRAIRADDQVLTDTGRGAAIIFPDVDQQGAYRILERIYHSICLLQAETIIPPLTHETDIVMGIGTYSEPATSLEQLLANAGTIALRQILRPAITTHLWDTMPDRDALSSQPPDDGLKHKSATKQGDADTSIRVSAKAHKQSLQSLDVSRQDVVVPFLRLPAQLSTRLKKLIPYAIAVQLRCAPVGRDHHRLTVAMADPVNADAIHRLQEITGMTIFPVSCKVEELDSLLEKAW